MKLESTQIDLGKWRNADDGGKWAEAAWLQGYAMRFPWIFLVLQCKDGEERWISRFPASRCMQRALCITWAAGGESDFAEPIILSSNWRG
jgi:hypothetical protein